MSDPNPAVVAGAGNRGFDQGVVVMDIIIVEDNESTRYRLVSIVEGFGEHRVVASFETVEEAVDFFAENTADIVILDLGLPGLSDDLAVKAIKAASPASTILVFTVKDEDEKIFSALK